MLLSTQLLHDNYGITLEAADPDNTEPLLQQPYLPAKADNAQLPPAVLAGGMQPQATQTEPSGATMSQTGSSAGQTSSPMHSGSGLHDQPAISAEADPRKGDGQQSCPAAGASPIQKQTGVLSWGLEAPRPLAAMPAAVPAKAALHDDDTQQALAAAPAVLPAQADAQPAEQTHTRAEAFPAREVPDSLHLDTSTLQELTALPSAHGRIPVSLKSPLPMAAARPAKGRGMGRLPSPLTRAVRPAKPSPAREAARAASRQPPSSRAPGMGSQGAVSQDPTGSRRLAHPATRKQLHFDDAIWHAPGKGSSSRKEAPESLQGSRATQQLPSQQAKPHAEQAPHHKAAEAHRGHASSAKVPRSLHGAASSDSDTPRIAAARLPQPVQQGAAINPLFDHSHGSAALQAPRLCSTQPAGSLLEATSLTAQGAGVNASPADQATALAKADAAGQSQQLQQGSTASAHVSIHTAHVPGIMHFSSACGVAHIQAESLTVLQPGRPATYTAAYSIVWVVQHTIVTMTVLCRVLYNGLSR